MAHREGIRDYLRDVRVYGVVHDWGCGTKPIKNYLKPNDAVFIGIDKLDHLGADIVADIEKPLVLPYVRGVQEMASFAFCLEAIEHVWDSKQLLANIFNNLAPGGLLYLSQPFMYETHKEDDVHRYTHHGLRRLLEESGFVVDDTASTGGRIETALGFVVKAHKELK